MQTESGSVVTEQALIQGNGQEAPPERRIAIVGFADSRVQAPYNDPSYEIWGCNDVYAHVPRVDVVFEIHHLLNLGMRRNPNHEQFLRSGAKPVWMIDPPPDFGSARKLPIDEILKTFPRGYFTNTISYMIAMAVMDILGQAPWQQRKHRLPGRIAIYGVDMAAPSEFIKEEDKGYAGQRPSCEYFVGIAEGLGIEVYIPDNSDLCKTTSLYGVSSTAPLRIKCQSKMEHLRAAKIQLMQQLAAKQGESQAIQSQIDQVRGQMGAYEYIVGVWTMATDIPVGAEAEAKDRGEPMPGSPLAEDKLLEEFVPVLTKENVGG